jgi:peptidoglycan/xylan/chitin deacetylase (PgdA/CDA1 family)
VTYDGTVEHLFFHAAIAYPELAFDGDSQEAGYDDYMVTVSEFRKILQNLYDKGYVLVNLNDVWADTDGWMRRQAVQVPEGKKPIVLSFDDINYYAYMRGNGFMSRLVLGADGEIWAEGTDPAGNPVMSQDLDSVTILDQFVREHPDFSVGGAKGMLCLTGYEGVLGYRTDAATAEPERSAAIAAVTPIIAKLKEEGWYFASHTWGHINLATSSYDQVTRDADRWQAEVAPLVGPTDILVYPFGARLDGDDVKQTGPEFWYYYNLGFRLFASVGASSFTAVKQDVDAVIMDRMHADGHTLRYNREYYQKFYDAPDIWDPARPMGDGYGRDW